MHMNDRILIVNELWRVVEETTKSMGRPDRLFEIDTATSALLVVDMQDGICSPTGCIENPDARGIVPKVNSLVRAARTASVPVIWIRFEVGKHQSDAGLWPLFQPASPRGPERGLPPVEFSTEGREAGIWHEMSCDQERDYSVAKCRYSAFTPGSSNLERLLRTLHRKTLIITGVGSNVCVESTARDAMMLDFEVVLVRDATATFDMVFHEMTLMNIKLFFGDVVTAEEVRQAWDGMKGTHER